MNYEVRNSSAADRKLKTTALPAGHLGSTSDEYELFVGSADTPIGRAVAAPQLPRDAVDVRRMWQVANMGQQNTWTDINSVAQDASGVKISPRPYLSPGVDVISTGYIMPNELADGGKVVIEATGTYLCGSIAPRILAGISIGGVAISPPYEGVNPNSGAVADVVGTVSGTFDWSSYTLGLNALAGYEALNVLATNLTQGEFQWKMRITIHSLGRYAKWQSGDDDDSAADASNCWIEAELEWGGLQYNAGGGMGEYYGAYNPQQVVNVQYQPFLPNGTVRGAVYSFLGQQWLCHAASTKSALNTAPAPDEIDATIWSNMLAEDAPGIGAHWKEHFVPLVSKARFNAFATVDWTEGNEVQFKLGGPQQVPLDTVFSAYGATTGYLAEFGTCSKGGLNYAAKTTLYGATFPRMVDGATVSLFTADATGAANSNRCWRELPTTLRDEMRMQTTQAYLFGRRNGVAQKRLR